MKTSGLNIAVAFPQLWSLGAPNWCFRGLRHEVLGGNHRHDNTVVIRFPDADAAENWFRSSAYQALIPLRMEAADVDLISYTADS